jgi:serine/threonine protein phosphatase PrpC
VRFHDDRNKLLKVLGNDENLNIRKIDDAVSIESGDAFLLCSDGFWEYVYEVEMEADLIKSDSPKDWIEYMIKRLLLRVTGNNDNFTAIAGFIS